MTLTSVDAIDAMVAPVVLITTGGLISNGLIQVYNSINDRMRDMTRERLDIRSGPNGEILEAAVLPPIGRERLSEIGRQLPLLMRRHQLTRAALLLIYAGIGVLCLSVIDVAVAVTLDSETWGQVSLGLVLAGTIVLLSGMLVAAASMAKSADAVSYAIERTQSLG